MYLYIIYYRMEDNNLSEQPNSKNIDDKYMYVPINN